MRPIALAAPLLLACAVASLCGCRGVQSSLGVARANELSYGDVQSIQTGLTAAQVRDAFGEPMSVARRPDGTVSRMQYAALDGKQGRAQLLLDFDERGVLVNKTFTGPIVKP